MWQVLQVSDTFTPFTVLENARCPTIAPRPRVQAPTAMTHFTTTTGSVGAPLDTDRGVGAVASCTTATAAGAGVVTRAYNVHCVPCLLHIHVYVEYCGKSSIVHGGGGIFQRYCVSVISMN